MIGLTFLHRDNCQRKTVCKSNAVGWVWWGVSMYAQTYRDLSAGGFCWSGGGIAALNIVQNERLIKF